VGAKRKAKKQLKVEQEVAKQRAAQDAKNCKKAEMRQLQQEQIAAWHRWADHRRFSRRRR
jgi:hypothetical protein